MKKLISYSDLFRVIQTLQINYIRMLAAKNGLIGDFEFGMSGG